MWWLVLIMVLTVLLAAVVVERRRRRRLSDDDRVFECRVRALGPAPEGWPMLGPRWSRVVRAWWVGDVLVVRRGPVFEREARFAARMCTDVKPLPRSPLGPHGIVVRLVGADDRQVEVTTIDYARVQLAGPYLVAALTYLPKAPEPRRRR
jgi:hypothetical protein